MNTIDRNAQIISQWNNGLSGGRIAAVLGISRNAVLGVLDRAKKRGEKIATHPTKADARAQRARPAFSPPRTRAAAAPVASAAEPEFCGPLQDFPPRGLCRYIAGEVTAQSAWRCCGAPAEPGRAYCAFHRALTHKTVKIAGAHALRKRTVVKISAIRMSTQW